MRSLLPFDWHPLVLTLILTVGLAHHLLVRSPRQRRLALYALLALLAVTMWPIGDLAASVSLSVATGQRLVIMLLVAPLLLLSSPTSLLGRMTRPAPIDFVVRTLAHPGVALIVVTVVGTATLVTPVVDWGARSTYGRDLILLTVLTVGFLLWIPALAIMPGTRRLSPAARAGYVFASSLVVTSLSFVWIFSRHPLYPALHHQEALLHV
ncbi:MAG TPA: cytochrome c oxidase assembly protein, partial [Acidimicrobiales bacterium]|nr:cytochrome c oxidase assembly protein [Acidimicrobiales bacterium]